MHGPNCRSTVPIHTSSSPYICGKLSRVVNSNNPIVIYPNEAMHAATGVRKHKFAMITKNLLHQCSPYNQKNCLGPRHARDSSEMLHCIISLMKTRLRQHLMIKT